MLGVGGRGGKMGMGEGSQRLTRKMVEERGSDEGDGEGSRVSRAEGGASSLEGRWAAVPGERSLVWLVERERGRLCRKRFILLKPRGSSASDMVSSDSAEAYDSLAAWSASPGWAP